ncbi:GAF domain-containing protein [Rheinheimera sp. UJ63]|uniref:GAF domain-containing protein n=1 Tax=Rheinheimera sp. UJ63 TaxID=2910157 RepID=UPI001F3E154F|nr:GAF domain-containing protein [Rheinheimera sp. UJ63]MCF4009013.1 histidine kinase [Rheinheimera sp. UJ63]
MSIPTQINHYLQLSGLKEQFSFFDQAFTEKTTAYYQALQQHIVDSSNAKVQWQYSVPELGEGGACSLFGVLDSEPYDLTAILGGQTRANHQALARLTKITEFYQQQSGLAWFGIYQARANLEQQLVLVKLSYYGAASRAEFPLNTEFAKISNNSTVGLTGQARVINDVAAYLQQGGEYYTCDPKVKAEACLPLFAQSGKIVGIIDAEDLKQQVFTAEALALLVAVCLSIPECLPAIA